MALQRAKASLISTKLGWSASRSAPRVSSENTTPQPKVASGGLRSITRTWWPGSAFFMSSAKYSPAGPPPRMPIFMATAGSSLEHVGQALELRHVGDGGQQHQVVAPGLLVPAHQVLDHLRRGQVARGDALGEGSGEGVVVAQVGGAALRVRLAAERVVGLPPQPRAARAAGLGPRRPGSGGRAREGARRAAAVDVAVAVPGHAREGTAAGAADQQVGAVGLRRPGPDPAAVLERLAQVGELGVEALAAVAVVDAHHDKVLAPGAAGPV